MRKIHFKNLNSPRSITITVLSVLLILLGVVLFLYTALENWGYILMATGIIVMAGFNLSYVWQPDAITYTQSGATIKLIGRKTFGFKFEDIDAVEMTASDLVINTTDGRSFSLSRKRYQQQSLIKLKELIHQGY